MTIFLTVCLLISTVYAGPASALVDLAAGKVASGGDAAQYCWSWTAGSYCSSGAGSHLGMSDGADGTAQASTSSSGCTGTCGNSLGYGNTVFSAGEVAYSARIVFEPPSVWCLSCKPGTFEVICAPSTGSPVVVYGPVSYPTSGELTTATFTTPCTLANGIVIQNNGNLPGHDFAVATFELYAAATVSAADYIFNLRASHPPFARHYLWQWVRPYTGSWYVTNGAGSTLACTIGCDQHSVSPTGGTIVAGFESGLEVDCLVICGHDTYTIHIDETGVGSASYAIDSDLDGVLIGTPALPVITSAQPCYQKTTGSCASVAGFSWASLSSTAGEAFVNYTFTGASTYTYTVSIQQSGEPVFGTVGRVPGSYTLFLPVDATATPQLILMVVGAGGQYVVADMALDFTAGGAGPVVTQDPTQGAGAGAAPSCDAIAIVCNLQQLFAAPGAALNTLALSTVQSIRQTMLTRQPFNFIVRAYDGVSGQLALASAAVTTTSTCTGLVLSVPLGSTSTWRPIPTGWVLPTQPPATSMPVTVADCASLEPLGGQTWYQAVRSAMDPAIYLLFAYSQLRRLQPRPVMAA